MGAQTRTFVIVWAALLVLLALTVGATFLPIGGFKPVVNIGIALAKAALIFWFFMHMRHERGLVRLAAIGAGAWLLILGLLLSSDFLTRSWL